MKFLIDNSLSPRIAQWLSEAGHDATHVLSLGLEAATDDMLFDQAAASDRVIIAMDTDFGTILAMRNAARPSVILFRRDIPGRPRMQADLLLRTLPTIQSDLEQGAIVVFDVGRIRVRSLPICE